MTDIGRASWYREPWVWFLVALPAATVLACAVTIWVVVRHPDPPIVHEPTVTEMLNANSVMPPKR